MASDFGFKKLRVWNRAVEFADYAISLTENLNTAFNHYRLIEQFESASASISMNIAEGKGRYSKKEYIHFLYIARGSLYETITIAEIFHERNWITEEQFRQLNEKAFTIAAMLKGLINKIY